MAQVLLDKLTKRYGDVLAVSALDLQVHDQELLVLVGPSGCGKTTALRMIAGLEAPSSGEIRIGGRLVNNLRPKDRQVAMVFQHGALYPHLDVYRNLAFGLQLRRRPATEIDQRVRAAARLLGLEELLARQPWQLSGGQRQRVAVGRAIVCQPTVFLLDEPLSHLDGPLRNALRTELVQLQQRLAATMILVTHDQVEAMTMGQRIAVMIAGRIQQVGTPLAVYDVPANRCVAEFIGNPTMRFLTGVLRAESASWQVELAVGRFPLPPEQYERCGPWAGRPVTIGVRPEAVRDVQPAGSDGLWLPLRAEVALVQPLGSETILELQCGGQLLAARVAARRPYVRGQVIDAYLNTSQCHLFDPTSGVRL
ncbi:MAG: ABC transporter ATP-binding protein [Planctomycetota bacterium]|nr:ABC transporter ATP-binding protein [Planctomycetota bacterium]